MHAYAAAGAEASRNRLGPSTGIEKSNLAQERNGNTTLNVLNGSDRDGLLGSKTTRCGSRRYDGDIRQLRDRAPKATQ